MTYTEELPTVESVTGEGVSIHERLILAPSDGRFKISPPQHFTTEGEYVVPGQTVGSMLATNGESIPIKSEFSGWVMGYLVLDGQPVKARQPLIWLRKL